MKNLLLIVLASGLLFSCGNGMDENPEDLAGKRKLLKQKQTELKVIENTIQELRAEILEMDPPKESAPIPVTTIQLAPSKFERYIQIQANAVSDDIVNASSEIGGRIVNLHVKENNYVKRGQLVATLDVESMDKQIDEVNKGLELANIVYERQKRLWDQNIGSEMQYLEAKNNKERIEKSLETLNSQKEKSKVYAPITGIVEMEFLKPGELASPGMPIVQILNTSRIKFVADVPENYLGKVDKGDMVKIFIPALNKEMEEKITQIGRVIDPTNRTFKIEIELNNPKGMLKPNLLAEVRFVDFKTKDVVAVPVNLIQEEVNGTKYLFIEQKMDTVHRAKKVIIETSESNSERIIISSGLTGNESLINDGSRSVTEGNRILITATQTQSDDK